MRSKREGSPQRFGEVAVARGYVRPVHVRKALGIQEFRRGSGKPVPLLGELLQENGWLSDQQADEVFAALLRSARRPSGLRGWWERLRGRRS